MAYNIGMEHNPCDICLDKNCPTNGVCNCKTCKSKDCCPKLLGLSATIRITTKCTQSCGHCCFESSPEKTDMMTIDTAKKIAQFYQNNPMYFANIMGGEVFCNPKYKEILSEILPHAKMARIVTNSDWVKEDPSFIDFVAQYKNVYLAISNDKYHTNKYVDDAIKLCEEKGVMYKLSDKDIVNSESVVPIGRSEYEYNIYASFGTYCSNPENKYSFLIDEEGEIYKCGFGVWDYDNVEDYLDGGFGERFQEFNKVFYGVFIPNCSACIRSYKLNGSKRQEELKKEKVKA